MSSAGNAIIEQHKLKNLQQAELIFDTAKVTQAVEYAISDSGATGHFLVDGAAAINVEPAKRPITIKMPNGKTIQSTHTCHLNIPWLPKRMTEAHIVPGLTHASLISTRKFCDAGCQVVFDLDECRVYYQGQLVLTGDRDANTSLWRLPINPTKAKASAAGNLYQPMMQTKARMHNAMLSTTDAAFSVYTIPHKQNQLKYIHKSF